MRRLTIALAATAMLSPVSAQQLSAETDQAMWCATAITLLDAMGVYPDSAPDAIALSRLWLQPAFREFDRLGLSEDAVAALVSSYNDELSMQLPNYLVSSDPDALRLDINACIEM